MDFNKINRELFSFIDGSPTAFHAVKSVECELEKAGFKRLSEAEKWDIKEGQKYFVTRNQSSIIAFTLPKSIYKGFLITAAHSDSPSFKVKENGEIKEDAMYTKLNTEPYGGMIMSSWMDRPLSLAGRAVIKTQNGIKSTLFNVDRDVLLIPNMAIHMQREINKGYAFNPQVDMLPLLGDENADYKKLIADEACEDKKDILSIEAFLYVREKGKNIGYNGEFIQSPRLDDLQCSFSCLKAFLNSESKSHVNVFSMFDNEEVGSSTKQGADSSFLKDVLKRINICLKKDEEDFICDISNSFMVSADNAHAVHPNFPNKSDSTNKNYLNHGPVIKFNSNQKYTTDAVSSAVFKTLCDDCGVKYQVFHNRSDAPGGSTLGNISNSHVSLNSIDIGLPQLAMHSAVETAGSKDTLYLIEVLKAFYSASFSQKSDGEYFTLTEVTNEKN